MCSILMSSFSFAVATDAPYIKTGTVGGERTAKLNELIRIEHNA